MVAPEVPVATVAAVPSPRLVRAVEAVAVSSLRLLVDSRSPRPEIWAGVFQFKIEPSFDMILPELPVIEGTSVASTDKASATSVRRAASEPLTGAARLIMRLLFMSNGADMVLGVVPSRLRVFSKAASIAAEFAFIDWIALLSAWRLLISVRASLAM